MTDKPEAASEIAEIRALKYIQQHVRLGYEGEEIPNGWGCDQCDSEWEATEVHKADCPVTRYKTQAAEVERLRAALQPFADYAPRSGSNLDRSVPNDLVITAGSPIARTQLTMGDCRNARAALEQSNDR